ncbi:MAG TPA: BT_3928 family protein [Flavipsychrobacter sp.]|nr:BT_3928 family protein [Flavipsychrobacter sp.]
MKYLLWLLRIIVGVLFIFSGLVKANDPLGLTYKMEEFFEVLHMTFFNQYAFAFSILMIAFEIISGVALLLGYAFRIFSFLLLLLNLWFTFLTAYALFSGKIKECGCFGDCIKISNEETFWKDVVLTIMSIILFIYRKRVEPVIKGRAGHIVMLIVTIFAFGIQWWSLKHLPFHDCLPYKKHANVYRKMLPPPGCVPDSFANIFIYQKDGVKKEFTQDNLPWQDTTWVFVDRIDKMVRKGNCDPEIKDFIISDENGNDRTVEILNTPGPTYLWFVKDAATANTANMDDLKSLIANAQKQNIPFYVLCSSVKEEAEAFRKKHGLEHVPFYVLDGTVSKTAMRSNPGLMLLDQGTIVEKWSYMDYPKDAQMVNNQPAH